MAASHIFLCIYGHGQCCCVFCFFSVFCFCAVFSVAVFSVYIWSRSVLLLSFSLNSCEVSAIYT